MVRFDAADIRAYYDRHTPSFLRFGQGGPAGVLHRAVWGPGVSTRLDAFHYVDDRIADLARPLPATAGVLHLVDLGCGVGASLCYLAERLPIRATGITWSPVQAKLAARRIRDAGLSDRVACVEGDYCAIPPSVGMADLVYAIESFVHGPAPETVLAACARLVRPDGLLIICDDFRRSAGSGAASRAIDRFCRGWHINTLLSQDELRVIAGAAGFDHQSTVNLSSLLEIRRARDIAINMVGAVAGRLPFISKRFDYLVGGSALQECLARGWIGYDFTVFRRIPVT